MFFFSYEYIADFFIIITELKIRVNNLMIYQISRDE